MTTQTPATEERLSRLEGAYEQVNERLGDLRTEMNERMNELARGQEALRSEINSRFNTVYAFLATLVAANLGTLVAILLKG